MFSLYFDIITLVISHISFDGRTLVLIASVPGHCLSFTSEMLKGIALKTTNFFFSFFLLHLKIYNLKQYNYINHLHHMKTRFLHK